MPNQPQMPEQDPSRNGPRRAEPGWIDRASKGLHILNFIFYLLGLRTIQYARAVGYAVGGFVRGPFLDALRRAGKGVLSGLRRAGRWLYNELTYPVTTLVRAVRNASRHTRAAFRKGRRDGVTCLLASIAYVFTQLGKALLHLLNYLAPAAAVYVLALLIGYYSSIGYALALKYDGVTIGYIEDLSVYDEAKVMLYDRLASINLTEDDVSIGQASYSVVFVPGSDLNTAADLCDEMIQSSISDLSVAYGVYVDGTYYGAVEDGDALRQYLQNRLDSAVAALNTSPVVDKGQSSQNTGLDDVERENGGRWQARFVKDVEVTEGYYPTAGLVAVEPLIELFDSVVSGEQTYVAQAGDSAWKIARNLEDVTLSELYAMNPWMEEGTVYPGDEVVISSEVPFLEIQLLAQITYTEDIPQSVDKVSSSSYNVGYAKVTDEGKPGEKQIVANVVYQNGVEVDREIVSERTLSEPVNGTMVVGTKQTGYSTVSTTQSGSSTPTSATGSFMWPVAGGYTSCGFYGYYNHGGQDIAAPYGTNIYASDSGLVEVSTRNDSIGYGNYIIINHGNGVKTLYAHCSARYVSAGTYVRKGDVIAAVGMTGWATGYHCHFEIRINGTRVDPSKYIGTTAW